MDAAFAGIPGLQAGAKDRGGELVTRDQIVHLMKLVDARLAPDQDVVGCFQDLVEEYVEECVREMMLYSKHRQDNTVDYRDAKLYFEKTFGTSVPGILAAVQPQQPPTESVMKSTYRRKPMSKTHLSHVQDFKKAKK